MYNMCGVHFLGVKPERQQPPWTGQISGEEKGIGYDDTVCVSDTCDPRQPVLRNIR